ncbi:probable cyclin-dependent serine/threonine-protein kinase DDB_G0292550 isoform X2 [Condylostylus longicornis]|uniref:probable cyclin-dependent serine/threonine-protein kinase DDB_G0292550 isoform X2 n=1 Tax=Condylostylus longicornis TaxID=2530218 RepID=UPI00244DE0A4|nr:probable cyclin-dependent serine/threonine-protein kinase DDB_G0292550 isoform X2 [Condylostylus longicornis]
MQRIKKILSGQSEVEVHLTLKKYVDRGLSVTIFCEHNVKHEILYKVLWLKSDHGKLFEYVRVRNPPFRNFSIPGAEIDWSKTDETKLSLNKLEFEASGHYYCEVSTDTPIFTKASQEEPLHVISPQSGPPAIKFKKKPPFYIGDQLIALCNTTVARPIPHITWLINGKKVSNEYLRPVNSISKSHRSKSHKQGSHQSKHQFQQLQLIHQQQQQQQQLQQQYQQNQHQQQLQLSHMKNNPPLLDRNTHQQLDYNNNNHNNHNGNNNNNNNDKIPSLRGFNSHGFNSWQEELPHQQYHQHRREGHHHGLYNQYNQYTNNEHETNYRSNFDNKYYELKKHSRNSFNRKYRRHLNDNNNGYSMRRSLGGSGGGLNGNSNIGVGNYGNSSIINDAAYSIQASINNGAISASSNSEGSGYGSGFLSTGSISSSSIGSGGGSISPSNSHINEATSKYHSHIPYNGTYAMSGIQIEIGEHHINNHGRLEITCLATIPAHVAPGEQYADYKTHSVKIDVERRPKPLPNKTTFDQQSTPQVPDGMAQLANNNSSNSVSINRVLPINLILSCLTILRV